MNQLLQSFFDFSYHEITTHLVQIIIKLSIILAIIISSKISKRFINKNLKNFCLIQNINHHTCILLIKGINYIITALAIIIILQNLGFEISPLITALGISGVALSFGMKDIISNIIAGIFIMLYQQFKIGDIIKIKDWQGEVIDINIRYTTLKNDDLIIFIPNAILYTTTVAIIQPKE